MSVVGDRHYRCVRARHELRDRSGRRTYRVRVAVASWVMGKKNWRPLYRCIIANAAANPDLVDRLLVSVLGPDTGETTAPDPEAP